MIKICEHCGKSFETDYESKLYCNKKCADAAARERDESFYNYPRKSLSLFVLLNALFAANALMFIPATTSAPVFVAINTPSGTREFNIRKIILKVPKATILV